MMDEETTHESTPQERRKTLLIHPSFQLRFISWMAALGVLVILLMRISHSWFFYRLKLQAVYAGVPQGHVFYQFIAERQAEMTWIELGCFAGVVCLSTVFGLILSHRIAGPLFRLRSHFEKVAETGLPEPLHFREDDFFRDLPDAYNLQFRNRAEKKKAG